jgi:hypothetical protein
MSSMHHHLQQEGLVALLFMVGIAQSEVGLASTVAGLLNLPRRLKDWGLVDSEVQPKMLSLGDLHIRAKGNSITVHIRAANQVQVMN